MRLTAGIFLLFLSVGLYGQDGATVEREVRRQDSLFWIAYNDCDLPAMRSFLADDVEFYHDKGGLSVGGDELVASMREYLCATDTNKLERRPVPGSIGVFPLADYGAYQIGEHRFHVRKAGRFTGEIEAARYANIWERRNGTWLMTRVVSYDHHWWQPGE
jgi:hypothetical protein